VKRRLALAVIALAAAAWAARQYASVTQPEPVSGRPGEKIEVSIPFKVLDGYHINANKPTFDYMIPTRMEWTSSALRHLGDTFPPPQHKAFGFSSGKKLAVYEGSQVLKTRFSIPANASAGRLTVEGKFRYQACDHQTCYPPYSVDVKVTVEVRR
jgi:thiol:disulfide interchange protein DsbD